jgi:hypothetical protein
MATGALGLSLPFSPMREVDGGVHLPEAKSSTAAEMKK